MRQITAAFFLFFLLFESYAADDVKKKEEVKPILVIWQETLKFGIADEILSVISSMKEKGETSLNPILESLFIETSSSKVKTAILDFFVELKYAGLKEQALKVISNFSENNKDFVVKIIKYLTILKAMELNDSIEDLINSIDDSISIAALQAIGELNAQDKAALLLEKLDDPDFSVKRKPEIILTLGKIKAVKSVDRLIKMIGDEGEEHLWRLYACDALGKIGDPSAVNPLKEVFDTDDALLRSYSAMALSNFSMADVIDILISGLRDNNWKVRLYSAKGLAHKDAGKAFEILKYKAEKDTSKDVRLESINTIAIIGTNECFDYLRTLYLNDTIAIESRKTALILLAQFDLPGTIKAIEEIVKKEIDKPMNKSPVIEETAKAIHKIISLELEPIFIRFMDSSNMLLRIYGIRGAVNNRFSSLKEKIKTLSEKDSVLSVKQEALSALEKL